MARLLLTISKCLIVAVLFFVATASLAQFENQAGNLRVIVTPERPRPEQIVVIDIESFIADLNRSNISWFVDGVLKKRGFGEKSFSVSSGPSGSVTSVVVRAELYGGGIAEKNIRIAPAEIDIVWEARTYTPPFYKGKALYTPGGTLRIVALPNLINENGIRLSSGNLIYTWKKDGVVLGSSSGYARDVVEITGSLLGRPIGISVDVESVDGNITARQAIAVPVARPLVLAYEHSPLSGVRYERSLSNTFELEDQEITLEAYPYFFSIEDRGDPRLKYTWKVNGRDVDLDPSNKAVLTLRRGEGVGSASISLAIENIREILQFAKQSFSVKFGESE